MIFVSFLGLSIMEWGPGEARRAIVQHWPGPTHLHTRTRPDNKLTKNDGAADECCVQFKC